MSEDFLEASHRRKVAAFRRARRIYSQQTQGEDLCQVIADAAENMPKVISDLAAQGKWLKVSTEVNRFMMSNGLVELVALSRTSKLSEFSALVVFEFKHFNTKRAVNALAAIVLLLVAAAAAAAVVLA